MSEKLVLIDGHSILFRAFYGMPISMTAPSGVHTNAVYGFLAILGKIVEEEKPDYLAAAFDLPTPTFRHELYADYKGNRGPAPDEFREQVPLIKDILADMGIPVLTADGWEADDLLGTLAAKAGAQGVQVALISGDRDLLQTASETTEVIIPKTKAGTTTYEHYRPDDVKAAFGVDPKTFIELKALMGDSSDNVPGLPGVGPKTALKILTQFGSIENAHDHVAAITPKKAMEAMRDNYDTLLLSRELVTIRTDAPVDFDREAFRAGNIYTQKAYEAFRRLGFKSLLSRFEQKAEPVREASGEVRVLSELSEFEEEIALAAEAGNLGLTLITEGKRLYAAALAFTGHLSVVCPEGFLTEEYIRDRIIFLIRSGASIAVPDVKQLAATLKIREGAGLNDAVLAAYLIDPLKSDWSADSISNAYLSKDLASREELFGKKGLAAAEGAEDFQAKLIRMAADEASAVFCAWPLLEQKLAEYEMLELYREIELPLTFVLARMEARGILTSREALKDYGEQLKGRIAELEAMIWEEAGEEFNLNSPKQLGVILFEKMKLPGGKKTKTGYSTAADVLEKLAPECPMIAHILEYRTLAKLKSTYADGLSVYIEEDGRIRTSFNQTVTATGRLSSTEPNLQNIPMREELGRRIRKCFIPKEGCVFVDADYSQIELRILAHLSGDETLIQAYSMEEDIHRITASQVFHTPFEEVTDLQRRNAKAVNFGIVYGISSFGLSQGLSISRKEAQDYIEQYFKTYPQIRSYLDGLIESAKTEGYAVSLFGRRRPVPELRASNFMQRSFGERVAMNTPLQGTAADIMKIAMIRVEKRLNEELPEAELILQIHDELLVEVPEEKAQAAAKIVEEEMERAAVLRVPLAAECHCGPDWYEAK